MRLLLLFFISFSIFSLKAQPGNYWSMGSNTEASILAAAVVGGGSGITSIYYNPAGISELTSNKISLDASLFHFNLYSFENAFGQNDLIDYLDYEVQPRFFSFVLHPKKRPKLSMQFAAFSRGNSLVKLNYFSESIVTEQVSKIQKIYSTQFDYENRFTDYWFGIGGAYNLTDNFVIGISFLGSVKSLMYFKSSNINLVSAVDTVIVPNSRWLSYDRQDLYVVSFITKIGIHHTLGSFTYGFNLSLPSLRLYGDGYHRREISMSNIYENGILVPDQVRAEQNNHIVSNFKEPFSFAAGLTYTSVSGRTRWFLSSEYFAPIETYKSIDNSRVADIYTDEYSPGTDFLTFDYGASAVVNVGVGIKHSLSESISLLGGVKTDFSHYEVTNNGDITDIGKYQIGIANLFHLSSGIQFKWKRSTTLFGIEYTYGKSEDILQFANYNYPGKYNKKFNWALQDYPTKSTSYSFNGLGIYLGLSLDF